MKSKSENWINEFIKDKETTSYVANFSDNAGVVKSVSNNYGVFSKRKIAAGEIIEECVARKLYTCLEDLYDENTLVDETLYNYSLINANLISDEGHSLVIASGNFLAYRKQKIYNAVAYFDKIFNTVVIRATKDILAGEEIFLNEVLVSSNETEQNTQNINKVEEGNEMKPKKSGGCGCGKNKNSKTKPDKILRTIDDNENTNLGKKFKSMVDGSELNSMKVESKGDNDYIR